MRKPPQAGSPVGAVTVSVWYVNAGDKGFTGGTGCFTGSATMERSVLH